jgi:hypothetical protein
MSVIGVRPWRRQRARMPRRPRVDRTSAAARVVLRNVRRHVDLAHLVDEVDRVKGFVGPDRAMPSRRKAPMRTEHRRRGLALGKVVGHRRMGVDDQPVAILHQQVLQARRIARRRARQKQCKSNA